MVVMLDQRPGAASCTGGVCWAVGGGGATLRVPGRAAGAPGSNRPEGGRRHAGTVAMRRRLVTGT